jgi:hypothetical protein
MRVTGVRALPIIGVIFLCIGSVILAVAAISGILENNSGRTAHADGVIVRADYRALVQFTATSGQTVLFRNQVSSTTDFEGEHLPVAYNPANPQNAAVDGLGGRWFITALFTLLGGLMFTAGFALFVAGRLLTSRLATPVV